MKAKKYACSIALLFSIILAMFVNSAYASTELDVLQVYITEQTMTVFINDELRTEGLHILISNQSAEITSAGSLSDDSVLIRTTILLDVSTSMPYVTRGRITELLNLIVERKLPHEEFRLVVFGEELITLHDFTVDRFDLANAIREINFDHRQSRIYEAIFDTLPIITSVNERPTFHRTIVITDGVDNTATGITREELFIRLQNDRYPIDVLSVSGNYVVENRELAAIARISGGRYFSLNPNADINGLVEWIGVSRFFYVEATVPATLLDGVTRQVDISAGANRITTDVRFPVWSAPPIAEPIPAPTDEANEPTNEVASAVDANPADTPLITIPPIPTETATSSSFITMFGDNTVVIFLGVGVAVLVIAAIIVASIVVRRKKKISSTRPDFEPNSIYGSGSGVKTEFISDGDYVSAEYTIKISKPNDISKSWTLPVTGDLLIGREEHCPVQLDDKSVAREQCKIVVTSTGLAVVNLSTTNKTVLNGRTVTETFPLQSGDALKFGRETLRIDYIQSLGSAVPPQEPPHNADKSKKTESVFY